MRTLQLFGCLLNVRLLHWYKVMCTVQHVQVQSTLRSKDAGQALSQLGLCFVVGLHQNSEKLRRQAIPQYALCEQANSTCVDPGAEGLHTKFCYSVGLAGAVQYGN